MKRSNRCGFAILALGIIYVTPLAFSQRPEETEGPGLKPGWPGWYRGGSKSDPNGPEPPSGGGRGGAAAATPGSRPERNYGYGGRGEDAVQPNCSHSIVCSPSRTGAGYQGQAHLRWRETMGYTYAYPFTDLPEGGGGVSAVDLDSKGNLWAVQRNAPGKPQVFKFDPNHKLILTVAEHVMGGHLNKLHGIKVDREDNVWITDTNGSTVQKLSPDGKLLLTLGVKYRRGDWDEAWGQRLIWEPTHVDFGPNGDIYIFEGHGNESPNDVDSGDPFNNIGAPRVIHLDKNGKFINQWFGNSTGPGKFNNTHGSAVDPTNGDVWIGDREDYRIVVYDKDGRFVRTLAMKNLICATYFDKQGQPWIATGHDGQVLKIDRDGNVLGAIGHGQGRGPGVFNEASYFTKDSRGHFFVGDTGIGRITEFVPPAGQASGANR
jgi:hypothetical protein